LGLNQKTHDKRRETYGFSSYPPSTDTQSS
jgi:hypothetical protein